jgi:hypothetical protein
VHVALLDTIAHRDPHTPACLTTGGTVVVPVLSAQPARKGSFKENNAQMQQTLYACQTALSTA